MLSRHAWPLLLAALSAAGLLRPACAQGDTESDTFSLVVLLAQPRPLDPAQLRAVASTTYGVELGDDAEETADFLVARDDSAVLKVGGQMFLLAFERKTWFADLEGSADNIADVNMALAIRGHRGFLSMTALNGSSAVKARKASYAAMGALVAALLGDDCLAISSSDRPEFVAIDAASKKRLAAGDFAAPAEEMLSIVVLTRTPREPVAAELRQAAAKAFGVPFAARRSERNWVLTREHTAFLDVKGVPIMLDFGDGPRIDPKTADDIEELRAAKAVRDHRGYLAVVSRGRFATVAAKTARYALMRRLVAELLDEDCLALSFDNVQALFPVDETTRDQLLRGDAPRPQNPPVLGVGDDDPEMRAAIDRARETWPQFAAHFEKAGADCFVKYPVTEGESTEHLWIEVKVIDGDKVRGVVGNEPVELKNVRLGSPIELDAKQISDWMYRENGKLHGGHTVELLRKRAGG